MSLTSALAWLSSAAPTEFARHGWAVHGAQSGTRCTHIVKPPPVGFGSVPPSLDAAFLARTITRLRSLLTRRYS